MFVLSSTEVVFRIWRSTKRPLVFVVLVLSLQTGTAQSSADESLASAIVKYYEGALSDAVREFSEKARVGDVGAQGALAFVLYHYNEVNGKWYLQDRNLTTRNSISWAKKAAENGNPVGQFYYGSLLHQPTKDASDCRRYDWIKKSADQGFALAKIAILRNQSIRFQTLGACGDKKKRITRSVAPYRMILNGQKDDIRLLSALIILKNLSSNDPRDVKLIKYAVDLLAALAKKGNVFALKQLAAANFAGIRSADQITALKPNRQASYQYLENAVAFGSALAAAELGCIYLDRNCIDFERPFFDFVIRKHGGWGGKPGDEANFDSAITWLEIAIELGLPVYHSLSWAYLERSKRTAAEGDLETALYWMFVASRYADDKEIRNNASGSNWVGAQITSVRQVAELHAKEIQDLGSFSEHRMQAIEGRVEQFQPFPHSNSPEHILVLPVVKSLR